MVWSASCYGVQNRSKCSLGPLKGSEKKLGGLSDLVFIFKSLKSFCENFDFSFKIPLGFSKDFDHDFQLLVVQKKNVPMVWSASCYGVQNRSKCSLDSLKGSEKKLGGLFFLFRFFCTKTFENNIYQNNVEI